MASGARTLRKTQEIPSGHDPAAYETRRLYARAADGAEVPITVLMRKGTPLDGSAPLLVYGYGSYGFAQEATFSIRNFSLVDRGWIWAIAHIRGGSDKGWGWFLDGRKFNKTNTFTDFIACTEHLVANGYGTAGRVAAYGGSAGGMLMGAIVNMRPDLWGAIIAAVPFVDVLNTMSDTTLPLTPPEWPEWGNPLKDAAAYDYIASYSPYDNVGGQALSADPRHRRALRPARHLVGAGEVDRAAARAHDQRQPRAAEDQHGGRPRRRLRPLRLPEGDRPRLRVRRLGDRGRRVEDQVREPGGRRGGGRRSTATTCCTVSAPSRRSRRRQAEIAARIAAVQALGLPYLVAEDEAGRVLGFAYASAFRPRAAYRYTAEDSVYIASGPGRAGRRQGAGRRGDRASARRWACASWWR